VVPERVADVPPALAVMVEQARGGPAELMERDPLRPLETAGLPRWTEDPVVEVVVVERPALVVIQSYVLGQGLNRSVRILNRPSTGRHRFMAST
jgi:hypothetical protein